MKDLTLEELERLGLVVLKKAGYYHREVEACVNVTSLQRNGGQTFLEGEIQGTKDEELLRSMTGRPTRKIQVHVCGDGCGKELTGEDLLHGSGFKEVGAVQEDWMNNLMGVVGHHVPPEEDENQRLREEAERHREGREKEKSPKRKEAEKKKRKKEKKEKSGKETEDADENLDVGQKKLKRLYGGTGLDPDLKSRSKILSKARRIGTKKKKKKKKGSSATGSQESSDSSEVSTSAEEGRSLFDTEGKLKRIWQRYPGALAATAISEAKSQLLTAAGTTWAMDKESIPPLLTQYARTVVIPGLSPPLAQEVLSVAQAVDHLLAGKPAAACDLLCQRMKSLESLGRGCHWSVGRQLELIRMDQSGLTDEAEALQAARKAKEEEKLKSLTSRPYAGRNSEGSGGSGGQYGRGQGKKGKDSKGNQKGRNEDHGRGKGGDGRKKDSDQGWRKKE